MPLDANDLILFARVIETGSISRAADRAGLPKSTVSRRLAALEASLGERLISRSTRRLAITEFGQTLLEHAQRLADETEAASALAQHCQATPRGTLRVSLPPDSLELDLAPLLRDFAARYPEVQLELDLSPRRVDLIAERFDVAVRIAAQLPDDGTLVARRLVTLQHGLYASPAYLARAGEPDVPADLLAHTALRLIVSGGEILPWRLARGAERWEGLPSGPLSANSVSLHRELAILGMGITALSERFGRLLVGQGLLQRVLPAWQLPTMTVWCVTAGRRLLPARTVAFIDMLRNALADTAPAA